MDQHLKYESNYQHEFAKGPKKSKDGNVFVELSHVRSVDFQEVLKRIREKAREEGKI